MFPIYGCQFTKEAMRYLVGTVKTLSQMDLAVLDPVLF